MRRGVRPRHCLDVEDADGAAVNVEGSGTLRLLAATMEASRRGGERDQEEAKRRYLEFMRRKKGRKESEARREALVDLCCSTASAAVVLSYLSPRSRFGDRHLPAGRPERAAAGCRAAMSWSRNGDPELNMISNLVDPDKICSDARLERVRTRPSLLSLLMMWIRLNFCAGRWSSLTALLKGKALLGSIVHKKTASVLCLTTVKNEDKLEFSKILEAIKIGKNGIL
ncbi:hypothetical protein PVAP13_9KG033808 [Panicum virgatum]|uniref:Uncharacterized protein n=1 Tax=Panicum virgatum TaxID=38727 RepID=A0A8T0NGI5_PANVG|nr:hypothetical protein PVAP13_9KG033808 [Panicum virgatum]